MLIAIGWLIGKSTTGPDKPAQPANIGEAVTYTAPGTQASNLAQAWQRYSTHGTTHFAQLWPAHRSCGQPVSREHRRGMTWTQRFQHCTMRDTVTILSTRPTPKPTSTPYFPPAFQTPTPYIAPPQPTDTPAPQPTQAVPPSDPVAYELYLMNQTRASYGLPAYSINQTESDGTGSCVGSHGHATHMAATDVLAHDQFPADICVSPIRAAGENIGYATGPVQQALQTIHSQMMAEPHDAAYCASGSNHACSILSSAYSSVGVGIVTVNGTTWMTVDFLG